MGRRLQSPRFQGEFNSAILSPDTGGTVFPHRSLDTYGVNAPLLWTNRGESKGGFAENSKFTPRTIAFSSPVLLRYKRSPCPSSEMHSDVCCASLPPWHRDHCSSRFPMARFCRPARLSRSAASRSLPPPLPTSAQLRRTPSTPPPYKGGLRSSSETCARPAYQTAEMRYVPADAWWLASCSRYRRPLLASGNFMLSRVRHTRTQKLQYGRDSGSVPSLGTLFEHAPQSTL